MKHGIMMDGNAVASKIKKQILSEVSKFSRKPHLVVIWIGNNPASARYIKWKKVDAKECGIECEVIHLPEDAEENQIINIITLHNMCKITDGIMVQLPLPDHLNKEKIINAIHPNKDVDGLTNYNAGLLMKGIRSGHVPCTPRGIMRLLEEYGFADNLPEDRVVIIGRSNIVGKPLFHLMLNANASVSIFHSKSPEFSMRKALGDATIVVSAAGVPGLIGDVDIEPGTIVIDVGTTMGSDGRLHGDCVFSDEALKESLYAWTPVPGGVGPMTRAMLMRNTLDAYKFQIIDGKG